jgi:hypothetical protein
MQLVQIGETRGKTIMDLIQELAARQQTEIEQLKRSALERENRRRNSRSHCSARAPSNRCSSS